MRSDTNEGVSAPDDDLPLVEDEGLAGTGGTGQAHYAQTGLAAVGATRAWVEGALDQW